MSFFYDDPEENNIDTDSGSEPDIDRSDYNTTDNGDTRSEGNDLGRKIKE